MSVTFIKHLHERALKLIDIETRYAELKRRKKQECLKKLDYNRKKLLDNVPAEFLEMKMEEFILVHKLDFDKALKSTLKVDEPARYQSPPQKNKKRKPIIQKKSAHHH